MWKSKRRAAALAQGAVIVSLPFLKVNGDKDIRVEPHSRKTGRVIVRPEGTMPGTITFIATGHGVEFRRKTGFL